MLFIIQSKLDKTLLINSLKKIIVHDGHHFHKIGQL